MDLSKRILITENVSFVLLSYEDYFYGFKPQILRDLKSFSHNVSLL